MTATANIKIQLGNCFKLLAACFYEPERDLFLQENLCDNLASLLASCHCREAAIAANSMKRALKEQRNEELKVEYAQLFVGPFELIAPPYGSVYLEKIRRLMGDSTIAVQKFYQEAGLSLDVKEAPDHIALELEFMHYLCLSQADAAAQEDNDLVHKFSVMQSEFMRTLLVPWVPSFCKSIRESAVDGFYNSLADCLEYFIGKSSSFYQMAAPLKNPEELDDHRASV